MNNQSITSPNANANTIPNVAIKIKELSYLKQTYLKFIMQMYPLLQDPLLKDYSNQLIRLLQNIINIHKNDVFLNICKYLRFTSKNNPQEENSKYKFFFKIYY